MNLDFNSEEVFTLLIKVSKEFKVDPTSSIEAERYFSDLLQEYDREDNLFSLSNWLREKIAENFISIAPFDQRPNWVQGANWPLCEGIPMTFMGQIDLSIKDNIKLQEYFHDDVSIYLFIDKRGSTEVITQVY